MQSLKLHTKKLDKQLVLGDFCKIFVFLNPEIPTKANKKIRFINTLKCITNTREIDVNTSLRFPPNGFRGKSQRCVPYRHFSTTIPFAFKTNLFIISHYFTKSSHGSK